MVPLAVHSIRLRTSVPRGVNIIVLGVLLALGCGSGTAWAQTAAPTGAPTPLAPSATPATPTAAVPKAPAAAIAPAAAPTKPQPAAAQPPSTAAPTFIKPVIASPEDLEFLTAQANFQARNYAPAYLELLPMANRGDARAQYLMGVMSDNGLGPVQLDVQEAARWYQKAADKNNADAQFALANAYSIGRGVPVDPKQALHWLTKAAGNGNVTAMMSLAGLYETGVGVARDPAKAADWTMRAANAGSVDAIYLYGVRLMLGDGVPKNERAATLWIERAAQRGNAAAALILGRSVGDGLKASPEQNIEAFTWLTLAARRGKGQIQTDAAQALRKLQPNMVPSDVLTAAQRAAAWHPLPQFAGLQPDPAYDLPGGLNNPLPPKPANAAQGGGANGAAGGGGGGG